CGALTRPGACPAAYSDHLLMAGLVPAWCRHFTLMERTGDVGSARIVKDNLAERARERMHGLAESLGNLLMEAFHYLALFAIGAITAWAAVMAFLGMLEKGHITVDDILLLFIYLELAAMVGIYFKTN